MTRKSHRKHKRGGSNINLPYSQSLVTAYGGRRHKHKRGMKGGSYTSASSYGTYVNGPVNAQYDRVFSQSGPDGNIQGNQSVGAQGQNLGFQHSPNASSLSLIQSAGSKRRRRATRSKKRRGGFLGQIINQAIVPFGLLGMQQSYRRKHNGSSKTRRYRR
jgi:hypothetical protein